jgi:hypothetical protein
MNICIRLFAGDARARSTNRVTASAAGLAEFAAGSSSGPISSACSSGRPSGSLLVVRMRGPGAARARPAAAVGEAVPDVPGDAQR